MKHTQIFWECSLYDRASGIKLKSTTKATRKAAREAFPLSDGQKKSRIVRIRKVIK